MCVCVCVCVCVCMRARVGAAVWVGLCGLRCMRRRVLFRGALASVSVMIGLY